MSGAVRAPTRALAVTVGYVVIATALAVSIWHGRRPVVHLDAGVVEASRWESPAGLLYYDVGEGFAAEPPIAIAYRSYASRQAYAVELPTARAVRALALGPLAGAGKLEITSLALERYGLRPIPLRTGADGVRPLREAEVEADGAGGILVVSTGPEARVQLATGLERLSALDHHAVAHGLAVALLYAPLVFGAALLHGTGTFRGMAAQYAARRTLTIGLLRLVVLATLGGIVWRGAYLVGSTATELPRLALAAEIAAPLWKDLVLVTLLCAFLWAGHAAAARHAGASFLPVLAILVTLGALACGYVIRLADYVHFYYGGDHLSLGFLRHARGTALDLRPTPALAGVLASTLAIGAALLGAIMAVHRALGAAAAARPRALGEFAFAGIALFAGPILAFWLLSQLPRRPLGADDPDRLANAAQAAFFPELRLAAMLFAREPVTEPPPLSPEVVEKLRGFGLVIDTSAPFPLWKPHVFQAPLPFRKRESARAPNVILIFIESLSRSLTSLDDDARRRDLTPNLAGFAAQGVEVEDVFNSTTPTFNGVLSTLCSYLPPVHSTSFHASGAAATRLNCAPRILARRGYTTLFVTGVERGYVHFGATLERLGIQHVLDSRSLGDELGERPLSWGYSDHQIFRYVRQMLERRAWETPFFLALGTTDSHAPFNQGRDVIPYGDGSSRLLNTVHSADDAFGQFWRWLDGSPYRDDTIVVVTADHAMFPGREYHEAIGAGEAVGSYYDEIPLLIVAPTHALPARLDGPASSIDVAPSILHLLDVDEPNHFEGQSVFESAGRRTGVLGLHDELFFYAERLGDGYRRASYGRDDVVRVCADNPPRGAAPAPGPLTLCEYLAWYRWKRALHYADRIWP